MSISSTIKKHLAAICAVCVVAIWGETFVSSKILLTEGFMPADIFFFRFVMAYLGMLFFSHQRLWADNWRDELMLMALGVLGGSLYFLSENMALVYSPASNVAILVGSTPLMTALLLSLFYKEERMHGKQILGSVVAFVGMAMVVLNGQLVLRLNPRGDILALGAALTWGFYSLVMKRVGHYDARFITRKVFAYGVVSIIPYFLFVHPLQADSSLWCEPKVWMNLVYLGVVASMLCYFLWNWVLSRLGVVRASNLLYFQSFCTMIVSHFVLGERITLIAILGTAILILGMAGAVRK